MERPVWSLRIVRLLFELPLEEEDFQTRAELINGSCRVLVLRQEGMQFVDDSLCQLAVPGDAIHDEPDSGFLVSQNVDEAVGLDIGARMRDEIRGKSMRYESLCRAPIEIVDSFQD